MSVDEDWLKRAADIVGADAVLVDAAGLESYGHDEYALETYVQTPKAVVKPSSEQQIAEIAKLCAQIGVPITARGGGTGLSAACVSDPQGVVLSLERLNKVVEADPENYALTVQAGVTLERINAAAEEIGLFFPPHPGDESAMAGGMVATNAGGARAVKVCSLFRGQVPGTPAHLRARSRRKCSHELHAQTTRGWSAGGGDPRLARQA